MASLERRVQVLFGEELYERMLAEADAERKSVGAYIREAVEERMEHRRADAQEALRRLWARVEAQPPVGPIDLEQEKELMDRDFLTRLP